jgi:hypothetical protein
MEESSRSFAVQHRSSPNPPAGLPGAAATAAERETERARSLRGLRQVLRDGIDGPLGRRLVQAGRVLASPREFVVRRVAAKAILRNARVPVRIDPRRGYAIVEREVLASRNYLGVDAVLDACRREVRALRPDLSAIHAAVAGKTRLTVDVFHDDLLARQPEFVEFMLQDAVLLPVVEYLGTVPFLARVALPHSDHVPELRTPAHHQRFHVDNDDFRQLKFFVNVFDVGLSQGPLSFLPVDVSARVLRGLQRDKKRVGLYTTFSDEEIFEHCDPSEVVRLIGPAGTAAYVDLSRCLHFGSRVQPGCERVMLVAAFLRYHWLHENQTSHLDPRGGLDRLRRLALRSPRMRPRGYFCPDPRAALVPKAPRDATSSAAGSFPD